MTAWVIQMMVMVLSVFTGSSQGKRDKVLYCSACKAIVDELNHSISQVDPKKTINVGSFRLNPDGTMKDKKVLHASVYTHTPLTCQSPNRCFLIGDPPMSKKWEGGSKFYQEETSRRTRLREGQPSVVTDWG
uniref:DUF3456 domain-containing protein n=2 Tax=Neolamprologus brichardi TaxID=32507 RepID=A0A3Q4GMY7_NEOBR